MSARMTFGEARAAVENLVTSEDPTVAAIELAGATDDLDVLKVAEYALLVPVVSTGLSGFLATDLVERPKPRVPHAFLQDLVGEDVANHVLHSYDETPPATRQAINLFAQKRDGTTASKFRTANARSILKEGAIFSAKSMISTVQLNAVIIDKTAPGLRASTAEYGDAIRRSYQPALARAVMHMVLNGVVSSAFLNQTTAERSKRPSIPNPQIVTYDHNHRRATLDGPLSRLGKGRPESVDVRVGCPLSFDPEQLKAYYVRAVDEVELHHGWNGQNN